MSDSKFTKHFKEQLLIGNIGILRGKKFVTRVVEIGDDRVTLQLEIIDGDGNVLVVAPDVEIGVGHTATYCDVDSLFSVNLKD